MGLLDSLGYQGGYGGLLDFLQNGSPLTKPQEVQQPQYDAMGNSFGQASVPMTAPDPFGPIPNLTQWAQQFAPKPQMPFNVGAAPLPGMAPGVLQSAQPQQPQPAPVQPPANQVNDIGVGGYQMPRMGGVADYTPQAPQAMPTDVSAQSRQLVEQPQTSQQPTFLSNQGGIGAGLRGVAANAHTGPIGALLGGIGSAMGMQNPAQQNLKAQYDALVPVLGQQKAMLAVMNPEAGKILLAQALEKKKFGFHKMDDGTLVRTDEMSGKADLAYGETTKQGTLAGPDGKPINIPEGLDAAGRKTFINEIAKINADAAGGKKTGEQATAEIFANKMELSNKTLASVANQGSSLAGKIASGLPMGNYLQSTEYQKYKQAASNFITALLRKESGAAIGKEEFDRYDKEYMPQPGDSREVLVQKSEARQVAIDGMKKGAGPGYKSPTTSPGAVRKYNPATGTIE
jgi:hypothetical protein